MCHGNSGSSGGPVEVLASLMPVMAITVGVVSLFAERLWDALPGNPYFDSLWATSTTMALILFGGLIAFLMVWTEFTVIANTSALTFMVAGTFKEIVTGTLSLNLLFLADWPCVTDVSCVDFTLVPYLLFCAWKIDLLADAFVL
jgi:hypothetical protein